MEKFAAEDKIEQMNAQKRRLKVQEHKRQVEDLLEERKKRAAFEREQAVRREEDEKRLEDLRRQIIEEERQRLLAEHASKLIGHLPRGVIRSTRDLEGLGEDVRHAYSARRRDDEYYDDN
jgi:hypothetical protein